MKVLILDNCQNWLVEKGKMYAVAEIRADGSVILVHPCESVKPTILKGEYVEVLCRFCGELKQLEGEGGMYCPHEDIEKKDDKDAETCKYFHIFSVGVKEKCQQ